MQADNGSGGLMEKSTGFPQMPQTVWVAYISFLFRSNTRRWVPSRSGRPIGAMHISLSESRGGRIFETSPLRVPSTVKRMCACSLRIVGDTIGSRSAEQAKPTGMVLMGVLLSTEKGSPCPRASLRCYQEIMPEIYCERFSGYIFFTIS